MKSLSDFENKLFKLPYQERKAIRESPGYKIFYQRFMVKLPVYEMQSESEIDIFGSFTTGNQYFDQQIANQEEWVFRTIFQLTNLWERRVPIIFKNHLEDTKKIHEIIQAHLNSIEDYMEGASKGLNINAADDISEALELARKLDDFGKGIYGHLQTHIPTDGFQRVDPFDPGGGKIIPDRRNAREDLRQRRYRDFGERIDYTKIRSRRRSRG